MNRRRHTFRFMPAPRVIQIPTLGCPLHPFGSIRFARVIDEQSAVSCAYQHIRQSIGIDIANRRLAARSGLIRKHVRRRRLSVASAPNPETADEKIQRSITAQRGDAYAAPVQSRRD
jgi:hypothetical protein